MIQVVMVAMFPSEAEARAAFDPPVTSEYQGVWHVPEPYGAVVHLFTDVAEADLVAFGWEKVE